MKYRIIETVVIDYEYIVEAQSEAEALDEVSCMPESEAISELAKDITRVSKGVVSG